MSKIKFITGAAGTGKSFTLRKLLETESRKHLICAPTGMAAINVGGSTIHRTFGVDVDSGQVRKRWEDVEVVYVDECSMVGAKLFSAMLEGAPNAEIVMVGDMAQLPPVRDKYWFQAPEVTAANIEKEVLTKNYRQDGDEDFLVVLNQIRDGSITRSNLNWLNRKSLTPENNADAVKLAFRNDTVRYFNERMITALPGEAVPFKADYGGVMKPTDCIAEELLLLKPGAKVMMITNDIEGRWVNGTLASVESVTPSRVDVRIGEHVHGVSKNVWRMKTPTQITPQREAELHRTLEMGVVPEMESVIRHWLATGIEYKTVGTCNQYPMKLAYAMTVHKSQGLTLERADISCAGFGHTHGIGYVALSRVKASAGLSLDKNLSQKDFKFDPIIADFI